MLDAEQLTALYDAHARELLAFLVSRTCEPEAAVDVLAETFAVAFENRRAFRGSNEKSALAWLYVIARNQLADYFRDEQARSRALARLGMQRRALTDVEYERVEVLAGIEQLRVLVTEHLGQLPEDQRQALWLRFVEEETYEEIATRLGIKQEAARARVSRGLRAIRAALALADDIPAGERTMHHA